MPADVTSLRDARSQRTRAECHAMLDAHGSWLDANPEKRLEVDHYWLREQERYLARVERQLAGGVYLRGPRKGRPYDARERRRKEEWASRLRASIARRRGSVAALEGFRRP